MKQRIIIAGPTASGKSDLAIHLARSLDAEIISVDSRQCYKQINIGTAKPTEQQLKTVPHHNISVLELTEADSVASFKKRADKYAEQIEQRGKTVLYCGGSTLHLQSIFHPLDDIPSSNSENLKKLERTADEEGLEHLYARLKEVDPEYATKMDGINRQRLFRALDVWMQTGKPFSSFHNRDAPSLPENMLFYALHHPRKVLHQRISDRTDQMFEQGLIEETRQILESGVDPNVQSLQTVGYREVISYLEGSLSLEQAKKDIKTSTRRYAKRQITWLRRWPFVQWLDKHQTETAKLVEKISGQVAALSKKG